MPVPKKRRSKSRKRLHRALWTAEAPKLTTCSNCGAAKRPHFVCPECGFYKGKTVIQIKTKEEAKDTQ